MRSRTAARRYHPTFDVLERRDVPSALGTGAVHAHAAGYTISLSGHRHHSMGLSLRHKETLDSCKSYEGDFTSVVVPPPPGAVLATHGALTGDLNAAYDFVMTSLVPDPQDPTTSSYTGHSVITLTKNGHQLFTDDTGVIHFLGDGTAQFRTTAKIVGGTENFRHATGQFVAPGTLDLATGMAAGTYTAMICKNDD